MSFFKRPFGDWKLEVKARDWKTQINSERLWNQRRELTRLLEFVD